MRCGILFVCAFLLKTFSASFGISEEFFNSARLGDIEKLKKYMSSGVTLHSRDPKGNTPIIIAAGRGQVEVIKFLLENRANPEDVTESGLFEGKSALCWAASQGRADVVALLLNAGADPERVSNRGIFEGKSALMWASSQGRTAVVRLLLSTGLDVDYSAKEGNFKVLPSPAHTFCNYCNSCVFTACRVRAV